ncbi:hypothetical protein [Paraglaciecola sp. MB-3u-78]|uniref:hypothetical protein n=1 Tax=Paraglaciecola sp. MB-3u-78 TaxID=2058332 RepID=UPI000C3398A8|nr:hypothetical protein [Paraglaciecola sp. MB-3u-78]PKH00239.1 hypothetical protein CXF95_06435 [Paraglaciecola sp. MB-3u-78]
MASDAIELVSTTTWLDPKIIIPAICVIIASVVIPLLLHVLKGKREKSDKILEIRTKAYTEYFKKFEDIAKGLGTDYEHFSKVTLVEEFRELLEAENSPDALIKFQETVGKFPHQIQESHRKAMEEVTVLKILGSSHLLKLTNEFESLNQEIMTLSSQWLEEMKQAFIMPDFDAPIAKEMTQKGLKAKELKEEIIKQMRIEINLE